MPNSDHKITSELSRDLNLFHVTMMGLGMMIGAGVFLGVGNTIHHAGPGGVLLTFTLNGVLALFTAMSYAELSSAIPRAGGAYNFARVGFGRGTSFIAGWMEWFASSVAGSLYAVTFAIYTVRFLTVTEVLPPMPISTGVLEKIVAGAIALLFIYINYRGTSETGKVGAFITFGQTLFLIVIGIIGVVVAIRDPSRFANFSDFMPKGWGKLFVTMGFTYVAFEGYEVIAQAGDETINPRENLPKAMIYSVAIVTVTYVLVAFATVIAAKAGPDGLIDGKAPWQWIGDFGGRGFGESVSRLMPFGNLFLTLAVIFASTSALNATVYSATRASFALGRDNMLPSFFAKISKTRKTPWVALLFTGGIVLAVALFLPTEGVASSASIMFLFLFFLVNICVIKIRYNLGDELQYGFLMPLFPVFPILAILTQPILAFELREVSALAWIVAPVWIGAGFVIYHLYSKAHAKPTEDEIQVLEEEEHDERDGERHRVMVAVANPDNALELVMNTYSLCRAKEAQVDLINMAQVPRQISLTDADVYLEQGKEALVEAMLYLGMQFPISTTIRYCRSVARGIISAIREKRIETLIMGWHGREGSRQFSMGSVIDPIIERAPCNIIVVKGGFNEEYSRILVPVAGGPNSTYALEVAGILAEEHNAEITVFTIATGKSPFDIVQFVERNYDKIRVPRESVHIKAEHAHNVVDGILKESETYDLVVLGATEEPMMYQFARESMPETIAKRCTKPLVMVKAMQQGIRSLIKRIV